MVARMMRCLQRRFGRLSASNFCDAALEPWPDEGFDLGVGVLFKSFQPGDRRAAPGPRAASRLPLPFSRRPRNWRRARPDDESGGRCQFRAARPGVASPQRSQAFTGEVLAVGVSTASAAAARPADRYLGDGLGEFAQRPLQRARQGARVGAGHRPWPCWWRRWRRGGSLATISSKSASDIRCLARRRSPARAWRLPGRCRSAAVGRGRGARTRACSRALRRSPGRCRRRWPHQRHEKARQTPTQGQVVLGAAESAVGGASPRASPAASRGILELLPPRAAPGRLPSSEATIAGSWVGGGGLGDDRGR